jgi:hypothetical protein
MNCWKVAYKSRQKAWTASVYMFTQHGWYNTPYRCKYCQKFHLTNKSAQPQPSKEFIERFNNWYGSEVL